MIRWLRNLIATESDIKVHLNLMCQNLIRCADCIDELRSENMALRIRGERLAESIEMNDWTAESAVRMSDCLASWREFEESSYGAG